LQNQIESQNIRPELSAVVRCAAGQEPISENLVYAGFVLESLLRAVKFPALANPAGN
jgi:hypothetical protein